MTLTRSLLSRAEEEERDAVPDAVRKRWLGHGRKVGLKADVHLLAFVLDPFVQGALTTAQGPDSITGIHLSNDIARRTLWLARDREGVCLFVCAPLTNTPEKK